MIRHTRLSNDTATTEIYTLSLHDALGGRRIIRSEEHTSELQSHDNLVCRLLLEKKNETFGGPFHVPLLHVQAEDRFLARVGAARRRSASGGGSQASGTRSRSAIFFFFFNDPATTEIYTLSLPDALPISRTVQLRVFLAGRVAVEADGVVLDAGRDRKSTRLNSSHTIISYAVFCLKK